ncbi:MAG: hypothetical protein KDB70_04945 [Mycobacterium sp.]|nr:hypothetical protein [Mycobacterium sp.]
MGVAPSRPVTVTRDEPGDYTITVGDTVLALDAVELMEVIRGCMGLDHEQDQYHRLKMALAVASWETRDILDNQPLLRRGLDLTWDDLRLLAALTLRVADPWE